MQYLLRKKIIFLSILLSSSFAAYSQNDEVYRPNHDEKHFYNSINIGLVSNYMDFQRGSGSNFYNRGYLLYPSFNKAIVMGLSGTYRLNKHFLIRFNPNLLINDAKDFSYKKSFSDSIVYKMSIPTTILNLPIALKLESDRYDFFKRPDFMRHYVFGGIKLDYDNSASKVVNGTDENGNKDVTTYYNLLNAIDYGYEFGLGLSFYLPYVTVSPEIKFSYGQQDLRKKTIYPIFYGLNKLTTNYVFFTMHVEWEW